MVKTGAFIEVVLRAHDLGAFGFHLEQEIASILAVAALGLGGEILRAAAEGDIQRGALGELLGDDVHLAAFLHMGIEGGYRGVREAAGGDDADGAAALFGEFEDREEGAALWADADDAVVHLDARGDGRGGGG